MKIRQSAPGFIFNLDRCKALSVPRLQPATKAEGMSLPRSRPPPASPAVSRRAPSPAVGKVGKATQRRRTKPEAVENSNFQSSTQCDYFFQADEHNQGDETFWNKVGTLGRRKKAEEVKEVVNEGKYAIDSPGMPKSAEMPPEVDIITGIFGICV